MTVVSFSDNKPSLVVSSRGWQIAYASTSRTRFIGQRTNDFIQTDVKVH